VVNAMFDMILETILIRTKPPSAHPMTMKRGFSRPKKHIGGFDAPNAFGIKSTVLFWQLFKLIPVSDIMVLLHEYYSLPGFFSTHRSFSLPT
jgi:hypothetical protein